jgi:hypothetical protein
MVELHVLAHMKAIIAVSDQTARLLYSRRMCLFGRTLMVRLMAATIYLLYKKCYV